MKNKDWFLEYIFVNPSMISKAIELNKLEELKEEILKIGGKPLFLYGLEKKKILNN